MQFDNLSSEFLKILSPQNASTNLDAIKLEAFVRQFSEGQTLTGQVTQVLSQGRALVNFQGTQVLVEPGRSVLPREVLTVQVDRLQPFPALKLLDSQIPRSTETGTGSHLPPPTRQEGVVTHLSATGIRREQTFSLRALEHGVRQSSAENTPGATGAKEAVAGKIAGPTADTLKSGPDISAAVKTSVKPQPGEGGSPSSQVSTPAAGVTASSQNKTVPRIAGQPASHPDPASGTARENQGSQGDVARLSRPSEFKVASDQFVTRETLGQLKLEPGSQIRLDVLRVQDSQTLLARTPQGTVMVKTANAGIFKPGDPVVATVQTHQGKFYLEGVPRDQIIQPVTAGMIKPVFPHRQPIGVLAADLEENVLRTPALKDLPIDPKLIERVQQTLHVLKTPAPEALNEARMQELVNRSGVNYEPQVRNLLLEGERPETRIRLEQDLKGQVLELARKLDDHIKKMSLPEPVLRQVSDMVQSIQRAIQGIEYHQLNQQFSRQENLPILLQIPNHVLGGEEEIQIYVRRDFEEQAGTDAGPKEHYKLVFLLDLSALGSLRIDTQVRQDGLNIQINGENTHVIEFINSRTGQLRESLQDMGFPAEILGRVQENVDMEMPDLIGERIIQEPTRLVDIET